MAEADYRLLTDATGQRIAEALEAFQAVPYVATIPTGQWSGSGNDRYITVQASNVTANSLLVPHYDSDSEALLNGPIWCVPAAGSFTIHTSAIPAGTVTVMVQLLGTLGEAQYQVLADVYSKSQTDALVAQSTAITQGDGTFTSDIVSPGRLKWAKYGRVVFVTGEFTPIKVENQNIIATGLPKPIFYVQFGGPTRSMLINADGELQYWFSSDKSLIRDDIAVTYISST